MSFSRIVSATGENPDAMRLPANGILIASMLAPRIPAGDDLPGMSRWNARSSHTRPLALFRTIADGPGHSAGFLQE